jgi:low affinity Fe/Cu permease
MSDDRSQIQRIGCHVSGAVADFAADPLAQVGFVLLCLIWFWLDLNVNVLTAALSILAITLTQMVLNSQQERERDAHRRDVALHAKLDELLLASRRARDELAGIEELEEEEIERLKKEGSPPHAGRDTAAVSLPT